MDWEEVSDVQTEDQWLADYCREAIASEPSSLPDGTQIFGPVTAHWFETEPGIAHIFVDGGTTDDRWFVRTLVQSQLQGHGFKHARYTFDWDLSKTAEVKEANWDDIMAKAKRLIQDGQVQILRNGAQNVVAQVQGDHGNYQSEFSRDDPNSQAITGWQCECPWDQFAFQRTRQWKKYEGRPCAHLLAAYWKSLATPLDEEYEPGGGQGGQGPQAPQGQGGAPGEVPGAGGTMGMPVDQSQMAQGPPQQVPPGMPDVMAQPPGNEILPQFPMDPALQPPIPPSLLPGGQGASVPGLRQPTPAGPVQYPGGTYSSWKIPGATMEFVSDASPFVNGMLVSPRYDDEGTWTGRTENFDPNQPAPIKAGQVGEVLGTDPITGMVNVLYEGGLANQMGKMQPHGIIGWHWPSHLRMRPDVKPPGPAVRRK